MLAINTSGAWWPSLVSHQPLALFRRALIYLSYGAKDGAHDQCCPGSFSLDRRVSMLFELMRKNGGSPRYCPELAGVRARFFT